ncbi:MAG TPA: hypothetical protein V6D29_19495, partial [Leptolyngbyaceae cyanobacterium]
MDKVRIYFATSSVILQDCNDQAMKLAIAISGSLTGYPIKLNYPFSRPTSSFMSRFPDYRELLQLTTIKNKCCKVKTFATT